MYDGKSGETLDTLRYLKYMEYIATSKVQLQPERLPQAERAAYFHILRVRLHIVIWKYLGRVQIDPRDWGWEVEGGAFCPIMTDLKPAPEELLKSSWGLCDASAGASASCYQTNHATQMYVPVGKMIWHVLPPVAIVEGL